MQAHAAALLICHERIAGEVTVHEHLSEQRTQWCQLTAHAWCFDCAMYVCSIHAESRHASHRTQLVDDEQPTERRSSPDRRSG